MVTRKRKYEKENMSEQLNNLKKKKGEGALSSLCERTLTMQLCVKILYYEN